MSFNLNRFIPVYLKKKSEKNIDYFILQSMEQVSVNGRQDDHQ